MNFSDVVLCLPEDLVARPGASWCFLKILVGSSVASQRNRGVSLHSEPQFSSWASAASDARDAEDAGNIFS